MDEIKEIYEELTTLCNENNMAMVKALFRHIIARLEIQQNSINRNTHKIQGMNKKFPPAEDYGV